MRRDRLLHAGPNKYHVRHQSLGPHVLIGGQSDQGSEDRCKPPERRLISTSACSRHRCSELHALRPRCGVDTWA